MKIFDNFKNYRRTNFLKVYKLGRKHAQNERLTMGIVESLRLLNDN